MKQRRNLPSILAVQFQSVVSSTFHPPLLLPHAASFAPLQTALLPSHQEREREREREKERERSFASIGEKQQPVWVLYCGVCSFPAEYREFGPDFEKCKLWLRQNVPDASDKEADKAAEQLQAVGISGGGGGETSGPNAGGASASKQEEIKRLPGGKTKKKEKQEVVIEKIIRNKRKCGTVVKGLDLFGIKLSDASKKLGKKFATGASVVKGPTEKELIDVQGDIAYDIVEFLAQTWPNHRY
ncbi:translation machinery-associated protein 22-like isoform X2 [Typha latifolia]|uniref:translation machinery-associated protein 22-like isoform X2 n=1 Tax=Typha latifolia TaxID=4733 RepID=UPI003C2D8342